VKEGIYTKFYGRDHLKELNVNGATVLKLLLEN
jgi:hypothetical protein